MKNESSLVVSVPPEMKRELFIMADKEMMSVSALVRRLLSSAMAKRKKP